METGPSDPSPAISRRKLLQVGAVGAGVAGAAWVTPSMLSLDRAVAAGSCDRLLDWDAFTTGNTFTSTIISGTTVSLATTLFHWTGTQDTAPTALNKTIQASPHGGITGKSLRIDQDAETNHGQQITFTFSAAVTNVSFTITDIDLSNGNWSDRVGIVSPAFVASAPGGNLIGIGANTNTFTDTNAAQGPFRTLVNSNIGDNSSLGNITLTFAGPLTSIVIRFWCGAEQGANQRINFGDISFTRC